MNNIHLETFIAIVEAGSFNKTAKEFRLKMHKNMLTSNNIVSRSDYEYLKSVIAEMQKKLHPSKKTSKSAGSFMNSIRKLLKPITRFQRGIT